MAPESNDIKVNAYRCLKKYWNSDSFRSQQLEIITEILQGRDVTVLFPTGGGKSICFQIPALLSPNLTLVITPLIALMDDQVEGLKRKGIKAEAIHSGKRKSDSERILDNCTWGNVKILYISPERFVNDNFFKRLESIPISIIAIDEAHCISQWGYDFRPSYLKIGEKTTLIPSATIVALTATATSKVLDDINTYSGLRNATMFKKSFYRENISLKVTKTEKKHSELKRILKAADGATSIVYVRSRREVKHLASLIEELGYKTEYYHAGLSFDKRKTILHEFLDDKIQVICATNAFGMGLDKANIRMVIHFDIPPSIEEYVQEYGRVGRDGLASEAHLLINESDLKYVKKKSKERYPSFDICLQLYSGLFKFYKIAIHSGQGEVRNFNINAFVQFAKLPAATIHHGLRVLENNGYIIRFEQRGARTTVILRCTIDELRKNDLSKDQKSVLISLVRLYEGILDSSCEINSKHLANYCEMKESAVNTRLLELSEMKWIAYRINEGGAKILFSKNRLPKNLFHLDLAAYNKEIRNSESKVNSMIELVNLQKCRSSYILNYFDEKNPKNCGKCENCLGTDGQSRVLNQLGKRQARMEEGIDD